MKTDLNSIKSELKRLADVDYLRKELNRLAKEIKNFDLSQSLTPKAKARVEKLERRFQSLKVSLQEIQTKADATFEKFAALVRRTRSASPQPTRGTVKKTSAKKAPAKKTAAPAAAPGAVKKTSGKKAPARKPKA